MWLWLILGLLALVSPARPAQAQSQCISSAIAGGTADALTVTAMPCLPSSSLLVLSISKTNLTNSPTLQALTQTAALPITFGSGSPMVPGGLVGGQTILVTSNGTRWIILGSTAGGGSGCLVSGPAGMVLNNGSGGCLTAAGLTGDVTTPGGTSLVTTVHSIGGDANVAFLDKVDQNVTGGANATAVSQPSGTITVDCGKGPAQYISNTGAFTINAPLNDGYCIFDVENAGGAGSVGVSGFSPNSIGGAGLDTIVGHFFRLYISRVHGHSKIDAVALQ